MLVISNSIFSDAVLKSKDYLNSPTFILNCILDSMYRQFHDDLVTAEFHIYSFLRKYKIEEPKLKAKKFVEWRKDIKYQNFNEININSYLEFPPNHVTAKHKEINSWCERNTKEVWRHGLLIETKLPDYPYRDLF